MNAKDLITKTMKEVEYESKFDDMFFNQEYPMPFFSKELRKENAEIKKYTVETRENLNFSYKGTNFPKLPENLNLSVAGEEMYIENEKYILRDNNSFGHVVLFEKNKSGNKKCLFDFEYELSFEGKELLEITKIDDSKYKKDIAEYFNIILEMFNAVYRYLNLP